MPLPSSCNLLSISTLLTNLLAIVTIDGGSFALSSSPTLCPPSFHRWFGVARRALLKSVDALRSTVGGWLRMLGGEQWPFCIHLRLDLISGIRHPARCTYTLRESNGLPRIAIPAPAPPSLCTEMYRDCVADMRCGRVVPCKRQLYTLASELPPSVLLSSVLCSLSRHRSREIWSSEFGTCNGTL